MSNLFEATRAFERWQRQELAAMKLEMVRSDLVLKHRIMGEDAFSFMRATFYRWVPVWRKVCAELAEAPRLLAVGDLHVENFGTWRDAEGRIVWGVNDVDEAATMPYSIDLVRLATSALLAWREQKLTTPPKAACKAILKGYADHLAKGGAPFVLEEDHPALRAAALSVERDPAHYWTKLAGLKPVAAPASVRRLLATQLPGRKLPARVMHRVAGAGSLGHPRYVALTTLGGAYLAREAKVELPSAYGWAMGRPDSKLHGEALIERAVRCPDPYYVISGRWLLRRIGPHCSRIELAMLPRLRDELRLLEAMGRETANLHLGSRPTIAAVRADLARRPKKWLFIAAKRMAEATIADWRAWRAKRS
jgi:hypothetical protein